MMSDNPLATYIIPRVAMNGGIFIFEMRVPDIRPHRSAHEHTAEHPRATGSFHAVTNTPAMTRRRSIRVPMGEVYFPR